MTIVLREVMRDAADAILAGERPAGVRVADDYPTEFSVGVAERVGAEGQFGPFFLSRTEDDLVVGEGDGAYTCQDEVLCDLVGKSFDRYEEDVCIADPVRSAGVGWEGRSCLRTCSAPRGPRGGSVGRRGRSRLE